MVSNNGIKEFERLLSLARKADEDRNKKSGSTMLPRSSMAGLNHVMTKILSQRSNKSRSTDV